MSWSSFWQNIVSIFERRKSEGAILAADWKKLCQDFNRVAGKKVIGKKK